MPEKKTERKIDPETDEVTFDGQDGQLPGYGIYYASQAAGRYFRDRRQASQDGNRPSAGNRSDLFPVTPDIDTEGLLILTNDGDLTHRLWHRESMWIKVYFAQIEGIPRIQRWNRWQPD